MRVARLTVEPLHLVRVDRLDVGTGVIRYGCKKPVRSGAAAS